MLMGDEWSSGAEAVEAQILHKVYSYASFARSRRVTRSSASVTRLFQATNKVETVVTCASFILATRMQSTVRTHVIIIAREQLRKAFLELGVALRERGQVGLDGAQLRQELLSGCRSLSATSHQARESLRTL